MLSQRLAASLSILGVLRATELRQRSRGAAGLDASPIWSILGCLALLSEMRTADSTSPSQLALLDQHLPVKLHEQVHEQEQGQLGDDEVATEISAFELGLRIDESGSESPEMSPD